jgi:hypothetical protein
MAIQHIPVAKSQYLNRISFFSRRSQVDHQSERTTAMPKQRKRFSPFRIWTKLNANKEKIKSSKLTKSVLRAFSLFRVTT